MKGYEETQCAISMLVNADDMLQRRRYEMQRKETRHLCAFMMSIAP
jgi:hypothetical protein